MWQCITKKKGLLDCSCLNVNERNVGDSLSANIM
jgi:hypothetical protein